MNKFLFIIMIVLVGVFGINLVERTQAAGTINIVPTFNSLGVTWKVSGGNNKQALVQYRSSNSSVWQTGFPMEYDNSKGEYRGSVVHLQADTDYEVKLTIEGTGTTVTGNQKTWTENVPIAKTVTVSDSSQTLVINESGTSNGYILYTPAAGKTATIDVRNQHKENIQVNGSFVIIRGLILKGGQQFGISLNKTVHDVIIENNDISGWGRVAADGWGYREGAIDASSSTNNTGPGELKRIVVQCNLIHDPRSDANNWDEQRTAIQTNQDGHHPQGPEAVFLMQSGGNHVIRYNTIRSSENHYFDDILGGGLNRYSGFPYTDTDIYGNSLENTWGDAIEADGDNANVRIWNNYFNKVSSAVSTGPVNLGPIYIWRNVVADTAKSHIRTDGAFIKTGSVNDSPYATNNGIRYLFHNTVMNTQNVLMNNPKPNHVTRNNIFDTQTLLNDPDKTPSNDIDYDLYSGRIVSAVAGTEAHGIVGVPSFSTTGVTNGWFLKNGTKGYDVGVILPNFNDNRVGKGPDMGAYEDGVAPLKFGNGACGTPQVNPIITTFPIPTIRPAISATPRPLPSTTITPDPGNENVDTDPNLENGPTPASSGPSIFPTPGEGYIHPGIDIKPAPNTSNSQYIYSTHAGFVTYAGPAPASLKEKGWMVQIETDLNRDNSPDVITRYNHIYPETIMINDFKYKRADYSPNYFIRMTENGMEKLPYGYGPYVARNQLLAIMGDSGSPGEKHVQYDIVTDRYQDLYDVNLDTFSCLDDPYFEICTTDPSRPGFFFPVNRNKGEVVRGPLYNNPGQATPPPAITPITF